MEHESQLTFSHSADYSYIDFALKARWAPFEQLAAEFATFVPREIADFSDERESELTRLRGLNPTSTDASLTNLIDAQIAARASLPIQLYLKFGDRVMSEYVTTAFLSHALCESAINAMLAIGLSITNAPELFGMLERSDIKEKWCIGPKSFHPSYALPKSGSLYKTLQHLTRQRNALVHYKIELEMQGKPVLHGSRFERGSLKEQLGWIRRFFSLPYDLASHLQKAVPQLPMILLFDSGPIQRVPMHTKA